VPGRAQGEQRVEAGAQAHFEQAQGPAAGLAQAGIEQRRQPGLNKHVLRFLPGAVRGMVMLVQRRHVQRGRAVGRAAHFYLWPFGKLFVFHS